MNIIIKAKNLELTSLFKDFIEKKIGGLKKFIDVLKEDNPGPEGHPGKTLAEVIVEVEKETEHHKKGKIFIVKARINLPGKSLMSQSRADGLLKAVTSVKDGLQAEIKKYKLKNIDKNRRKKSLAKKRI